MPSWRKKNAGVESQGSIVPLGVLSFLDAELAKKRRGRVAGVECGPLGSYYSLVGSKPSLGRSLRTNYLRSNRKGSSVPLRVHAAARRAPEPSLSQFSNMFVCMCLGTALSGLNLGLVRRFLLGEPAGSPQTSPRAIPQARAIGNSSRQ